MKRISFVLIFLSTFGLLRAQNNEVTSRIILIGDAGQINTRQQHVINAAADHVLRGKTTVLFLGDNVYPRGTGIKGSREETKTHHIIDSQSIPFLATGVPVFFIPGNHDWDASGKKGLEKIQSLNNYIKLKKDTLLKVAPRDGCPDPLVIKTSENLVVIALDTEWFVYPHQIRRDAKECLCNSPDQVIKSLTALVAVNRGKTILLASHHPVKSYGNHGGFFSLRDHLFPLMAINKSLILPLPFVGSLYPLLRKSFPMKEDLRHPRYKNMIAGLNEAVRGSSNLIFVAGHEHALELITGDHLQVVSGAGSNREYAKKGGSALFADAREGFVVADQLTDLRMRFSFYAFVKGGVKEVFTYYQTRE